MRGDGLEASVSRRRLRGRLIALGVAPVLATGVIAGAALFVRAALLPNERAALVLAVALLAAAGAAFAALRLARGILGPFSALVRFIEGDEEQPVRAAVLADPTWELYTLYRHVHRLVQQNRTGRRALEEVEGIARGAEALAETLANMESEPADAIPSIEGPLAPLCDGLQEFLRRRGNVRHESGELARQLAETLLELRTSVDELASRTERGYVAATGAALLQRDFERRLGQCLLPDGAVDETPSIAVSLVAEEAGRIENRLAVITSQHAEDAPPDLVADLKNTIECVRALEEGTREALEELERRLRAPQNGYRATSAAFDLLKEKVTELSLHVAEIAAALEATSRSAERTRRLLSQAMREVEAFRHRFAPEIPVAEA